MTPRAVPVGDSALSVEFDGAESNARVRALDAVLQESPFPAFCESVPGMRSLLVIYDPRREGFEEAAREVLARVPKELELPTPRLHVIPTLYEGPDLSEVAQGSGLSVDEVIHLHRGQRYTALMVGFTPGFAYLGSVPQALVTKRRSQPRVRVPAGSVGIAGTYTGVYPAASAGGWNLIGLTRTRFFDPFSKEPSLIRPGDIVQFVQVSQLQAPPQAQGLPSSGPKDVEVLDGGFLTTVQDAGRRGFRRAGVASAGPMDARAHADGNRLLGNSRAASAIEMTLTGPTLRFLRPLRFALTGADFEAILSRADLGDWPCPIGGPILARAGNILRFQGRRSGSRAYLALEGGVRLEPILGSCSTDLLGGFGGFGGRALRAGDFLDVGPSRGVPAGILEAPAPSQDIEVRVILGPQEGHFTKAARESFLRETFPVSLESDRVGCRLDGPRLGRLITNEMPSEGMVPGSIEVPPEGRPIVMMADGPTTGGYPKIATVVTEDLPLLAQLVPGEGRVRFRSVSVLEAQQGLRRG